MPFDSEKQRRWLWMHHPEIAKKWAKEAEHMSKGGTIKSGGRNKFGQLFMALDAERKMRHMADGGEVKPPVYFEPGGDPEDQNPVMAAEQRAKVEHWSPSAVAGRAWEGIKEIPSMIKQGIEDAPQAAKQAWENPGVAFDAASEYIGATPMARTIARTIAPKLVNTNVTNRQAEYAGMTPEEQRTSDLVQTAIPLVHAAVPAVKGIARTLSEGPRLPPSAAPELVGGSNRPSPPRAPEQAPMMMEGPKEPKSGKVLEFKRPEVAPAPVSEAPPETPSQWADWEKKLKHHGESQGVQFEPGAFPANEPIPVPKSMSWSEFAMQHPDKARKFVEAQKLMEQHGSRNPFRDNKNFRFTDHGDGTITANHGDIGFEEGQIVFDPKGDGWANTEYMNAADYNRIMKNTPEFEQRNESITPSQEARFEAAKKRVEEAGGPSGFRRKMAFANKDPEGVPVIEGGLQSPDSRPVFETPEGVVHPQAPGTKFKVSINRNGVESVIGYFDTHSEALQKAEMYNAHVGAGSESAGAAMIDEVSAPSRNSAGNVALSPSFAEKMGVVHPQAPIDWGSNDVIPSSPKEGTGVPVPAGVPPVQNANEISLASHQRMPFDSFKSNGMNGPKQRSWNFEAEPATPEPAAPKPQVPVPQAQKLTMQQAVQNYKQMFERFKKAIGREPRDMGEIKAWDVASNQPEFDKTVSPRPLAEAEAIATANGKKGLYGGRNYNDVHGLRTQAIRFDGVLAKHGMKVGPTLGSGYYGTAFDILDSPQYKGQVLKITPNVEEALVSNGLVGKENPHIAKIEKVFRFPVTKEQTEPLFGIVMEKLRTVGKGTSGPAAARSQYPMEQHTTVSHIRRTIGDAAWQDPSRSFDSIATEYADRLKRGMGSQYDENTVKEALQHLRDRHIPQIREDLIKNGVHFNDMHSGNMGQDAKGNWKVFDLGAGSKSNKMVDPRILLGLTPLIPLLGKEDK